jgi:hypothetical protein
MWRTSFTVLMNLHPCISALSRPIHYARRHKLFIKICPASGAFIWLEAPFSANYAQERFRNGLLAFRSFSVSYMIRRAWHDSQPPMGSGPRGLTRQLGDRRTEPKGIGKKRPQGRRSGQRGGPDPQTTMLLTDRAAWSRPRQISEAACKGRPPDPGLLIRGFCSDPAAFRRRGSEVRERPDEAGFAAIRRSLAQRARNGPLKRSPRFEGGEVSG